MSLSEPLQEKCRLQCKVLICVTQGLNQHVIVLPSLLKIRFLAIYVLTIITKQFTSTSRSGVVPRTKTSLTPGRDLSWPPHVLRMVSLARLLPGAEKTATSRKSSSCLGWGSSSNVLSSGLTSSLMSLVISLHSGKLRGLNCSSQAQQSNMS